MLTEPIYQQIQHEIRTPLATIFGMVAFLKEGSLSLEQQQYVEYIFQSANHLLNFVETLKCSFSSIQQITHRVLIVEDNELIQLVHKKMLNQLSCAVDVASTGKEALAFVLENAYDLILLDIGLPDINGIDIARKLRENNKCSKTRLVALTAYFDVDTKDKCLAAGIEQVVYKPVDSKVLSLLLNRCNLLQSNNEEEIAHAHLT